MPPHRKYKNKCSISIIILNYGNEFMLRYVQSRQKALSAGTVATIKAFHSAFIWFLMSEGRVSNSASSTIRPLRFKA